MRVTSNVLQCIDDNSSLFANNLNSAIPRDYVTPSFPSLYWPFPINGVQASYLYRISDVWRFTTLWTLIVFGALYGPASIYAVLMNLRAWKMIWIVPILFIVIGGVEAVMAGSIVGAL